MPIEQNEEWLQVIREFNTELQEKGYITAIDAARILYPALGLDQNLKWLQYREDLRLIGWTSGPLDEG